MRTNPKQALTDLKHGGTQLYLWLQNRGLTEMAYFAAAILSAIALLSIILHILLHRNPASELTVTQYFIDLRHRWCEVTAILLFSISIAYLALRITNRKAEQYIKTHLGHIKTFPWISGLLALVLMTLLTLFLGMAVRDSSLIDMFDNPGGIFALFTGFVTCIGVFLTFLQVAEYRSTIHTFKDYLLRVMALLDEAEGEEGEDDDVKMCVLTPASGCLVERDKLWMKVATKVENAKLLSLTCLNEGPMNDWFHAYANRENELKKKDHMLKLITDGLDKAEQVVKVRTTKARGIHSQLADKDGKEGSYDSFDVVRGEWEDLPPVYLIASNKRAIVSCNFFLPYPADTKWYGLEHERVKMIGFDTRDPNIIDSVRKEIDILRGRIRAKQDSTPDCRDQSPQVPS
jgi:hypothetical protein